MENKKLKMDINLKTGKYAFDDGEDVVSMLMKNESRSLISKMKDLRDEIVEEYDFSADMMSRVDPILYEKLKEYDNKKGTIYTNRYLNVVAKEIDKEENEPMGVYLERCAKIRKKSLQEAGLEINYVMATRSEMQSDMSLIEKLEIIRMAGRQVAIGATISDKSIYDEDASKKDVEAIATESQVQDSKIDIASEVKPEQVVESETVESDNIVNESAVEPEIVIEPKMAVPSFLQEVLDKRDSRDNLENPENMSDKKSEEIINMAEISTATSEDKADTMTEKSDKKTTKRTARKTLSRRQSIQASKKAMRESRKMKNIYKQKVEQAGKSKATTTQTKKPKKNKVTISTDTKKKDIEFIPIKDGKMVGIDSNRPSAIVKTFVLEVPKKEKIEKAKVEQEDVTSKIVLADEPKKEGIVRRYTRKLKNKADSIRNRIAMSKDRFRKAAAVAAIGAFVVIAGSIIIPKAVASIPLGNEQASKVTIQAFDGVEQVSVKELNVDAEAPSIELLDTTAELEQKSVSSYIRGVELQTTGNVSDETALSNATVKNLESIEKEVVPEVEEKQEFSEEVEEEKAVEEEKTIDNDSTAYLESVRVGSRMKIDKGKYFENPDGSGNYGMFENHVGEAKILSRIGIATNEGYFSISSEDVSLLELKQKYPDAKFSYHFVDDAGHILGWLTSESFENIVEQYVDDGMDR